MRPVVVAVAITGSMPRKKDNPSPPATPREPTEPTRQAFEASAAPADRHIAAGRFWSEAIDWSLSARRQRLARRARRQYSPRRSPGFEECGIAGNRGGPMRQTRRAVHFTGQSAPCLA
jgi:hypothetical protein